MNSINCIMICGKGYSGGSSTYCMMRTQITFGLILHYIGILEFGIYKVGAKVGLYFLRMCC